MTVEPFGKVTATTSRAIPPQSGFPVAVASGIDETNGAGGAKVATISAPRVPPGRVDIPPLSGERIFPRKPVADGHFVRETFTRELNTHEVAMASFLWPA